jgi:predicted DNA-binding ribbon-helix-helix protein
VTLGPRGKSLIAKRVVFVGTRKTTVSVEPAFWEALKEIATAQNLSCNKLITQINQERQHANLSSAIRLYVLDYYVKAKVTGKEAKH